MIIFQRLAKRLLCLIISLLILNTAWAIELMKWERIPLAISLYVGQERVIFVDQNVRVGIPSSLSSKLRVQSTGGTLYLMAHEEIAPTRIQLQNAQTGALILVDIAATTAVENTPALEAIQIIEGDHTPVRYGMNNRSSVEGSTTLIQNTPAIKVDGNATTITRPSQHRETPIPVILTRYAAQNLYAPLRTVEPVAGVARVNINQKLNLQTLLPMLPIQTKVLAAWRLEDYWVSAVHLKNTSQHRIVLDPRLLQGNFIAATFQHADLGPFGQASDTTVVYLITHKKGLSQSIVPVISQINAQNNLITGALDEK